MGLDKVVKDISDKVETECKNIAQKAAAESAEIKKSADSEAALLYSAEVARADQAIVKIRQREFASAKLDVKKMKLNAEKDVLDDVRANFVKALSALPKDRRAAILHKLVELARKDIPQGKIMTNAEDADLVKSSGYQYGGNIKCSGGIMVTNADGTVNLDYTFDSILEDVWTSSMKPVSDILFNR